MTTFPESHADLLQSRVASLATIGPDGFPQVTALWFVLDDDGVVKISLNKARQKTRNLLARPEVALFILDLSNPMRYLEIRARADVQPDPDYEFADKVGQKYGGVDLRRMDRPGEGRVVVSLHPVKVNAVDLTR
jgi:PPOX class probable F420-dependent enzyme